MYSRDKFEEILNMMNVPKKIYFYQGRNHYTTYPDQYGTFIRIFKIWEFEEMYKQWLIINKIRWTG